MFNHECSEINYISFAHSVIDVWFCGCDYIDHLLHC